jgi:monofunctional chorismate mutase
MVVAVRGAIQVAENSEAAIREATLRLVSELLERNCVQEGRVISLLFSVTRDLTKANPATAARSLGLEHSPLFCLQEAEIEGSLARVIRVLLTYESEGDRAPVPVYLEGAAALRPDLAGGA